MRHNTQEEILRNWVGELKASVEQALSLLHASAGSARWKPEVNDPYFIIMLDGSTRQFAWRNHHFDHFFWGVGNCFQTRQEAEHARDAIQAVLRNFHA
jgi:hypothetical protein